MSRTGQRRAGLGGIPEGASHLPTTFSGPSQRYGIHGEHSGSRTAIATLLPATLFIDNRAVPATMLDISEGGAALSTQSLPIMKTVGLEFVIPGATAAIRTSAEVVWKDVRGRFGTQFVGMEAGSRKLLSQG